MKGRIEAFPSIWKFKDQAIYYLMRKTPNIFCFEHENPSHRKILSSLTLSMKPQAIGLPTFSVLGTKYIAIYSSILITPPTP